MNAVVFPPLQQQIPVGHYRKQALVLACSSEPHRLLSQALEQHDYQLVIGTGLAEVRRQFSRQPPAVVLMTDGLFADRGCEALTEIRKLAAGPAIPIMLMTAPGDENLLTRFFDAGGDDFLPLPLTRSCLEFKLKAVERAQDMRNQLSGLYNRMKQEETMAESVFRGAVLAGNVALDKIHSVLRPAQLFSGDVLLSAYTPCGNLNVLLGDFTGHGLAAALGALPTSEVFRAMTRKGFSSPQILSGINRKLYELMPTGMFLAVQLVSISRSLKHFTVCNCGMPDCLLLEHQSGRLIDRFKSESIPLGIKPDIDFKNATRHIELHGDERILMFSDGAMEARDRRGQQFGQVGLNRSISRRQNGRDYIHGLTRALDIFCGNAPQQDDISMAEIPCVPELFQPWEASNGPAGQTSAAPCGPGASGNTFQFCLTLSGSRLRQADPIPLIVNQIQAVEGLHSHRRTLFTILTELYVNALDHGVLCLDSTLKSSPEGFTRYFKERGKRLHELETGAISISVSSATTAEGGRILINIADSGDGFDYRKFDHDGQRRHNLPSGRGILLLRELCDSLQFSAPGNQVEAVFSWRR